MSRDPGGTLEPAPPVRKMIPSGCVTLSTQRPCALVTFACFWLCAWLLLVTTPGAIAAVLRVDAARPVGVPEDGLSWATAFINVQAALDAATPGDEVWVAAGVYRENVTVPHGVALLGGFKGIELDAGERDWRTILSILDGGASGSTVTIQPGVGGGVVLVGGEPVVCNNLITANVATNSPGRAPSCWGGGIWVGSSSRAHITGNTVVGNWAVSSFGGDFGGGISIGSSGGRFANNIVAFNSSGILASVTVSPSQFLHNCVYGNSITNYSNLSDPTGVNGNISEDPRFADTHTYRLGSDSPCIDAGLDSSFSAALRRIC
jgi:nitrous oxidase accessory protein NosD